MKQIDEEAKSPSIHELSEKPRRARSLTSFENLLKDYNFNTISSVIISLHFY